MIEAALIGATVESMQLWDLLRSVDYLVEGEGMKLDGVSVYGRKHMGALGLYAAALDPRITRVILDDPPSSHWQAAPLLNVLRVTDLPEAAGLVAPREIVSAIKWAYTKTNLRYVRNIVHAFSLFFLPIFKLAGCLHSDFGNLSRLAVDFGNASMS